jgi:uncharacterized protein
VLARGRIPCTPEEKFMFSISKALIPAFEQSLGALTLLLDKLEAHCTAKSIDPAVFLAARLYPDMFPFTRQVQIACDFAKGAVCRLAGRDVPAWPDDEVSLADLKARVAKTLALVMASPADALDASADKLITVRLGRNAPETQLLGQTYLVNVVLPNFYFHLTTAYAILRHNGVEIGKNDFLKRG